MAEEARGGSPLPATSAIFMGARMPGLVVGQPGGRPSEWELVRGDETAGAGWDAVRRRREMKNFTRPWRHCRNE